MQTGTTTRVSVDSSGTQGNLFWSRYPSISADGRYVAFESDASNLVSGDTNGWTDVFVHDMQTGSTTRVSVDSSGEQGNDASSPWSPPSISADGSKVAFFSYASNMVSGDGNYKSDIFVHDMQTGITVRLSLDSIGMAGNGNSYNPSISEDGSYVAFESDAINLVSGDTNDATDIFVVPATTYNLTADKTGSGSGTVTSRTSSPPGIVCGTVCEYAFTSGTTATLIASPAAGSLFSGWSGGGCSGNGICAETLTADSDISANFTSGTSYALTVNKTGSGLGTVNSNPPGIACGMACASAFPPNTVVTLTAVPYTDPDYAATFTGWSGSGCSGTGTCTVTMTAAAAVSAHFKSNYSNTLTVSKTGTGSGTVTSSPAGITCGAVCASDFVPDSKVDLSSVPASGSHFSGWSGGGCSGTGTCTVTMDNYKAVVANFLINAKVTMTFTSTGSQDGWMLESSKGSGKGGSLNASASTFKLGDDKLNRQYRGLLSFNTTSLPDNAIIQSVVLKVKQSGGVIGSNPFSTLGSLYVDIRKGYFGSSSLLQVSDFNAAATASKVGTIGKTPVGGWYSVTLNASGRSDINKTNLTQLRLYFSKATNANNKADSMNFVSGEVASARPQLIIIYTLP
jgi:hypothetical protein